MGSMSPSPDCPKSTPRWALKKAGEPLKLPSGAAGHVRAKSAKPPAERTPDGPPDLEVVP